MTPTVAVLHGDQTGEELLLDARRLLAKDVIGLEVAQRDFDLSLANRRETRNEVVHEAAAIVWTLASPEVHGLLRGERGWSQKRYISWLADTMTRTLLN